MKEKRVGLDPALVVGILLALSSVGLLLIHPAVAFAPLAALLVGWAFARLPIRFFALLLFTFAFVLEVPGEMFCQGAFKTPWNIVGALFFGQLKHTIPVGALVFTGLDLTLLLLLVVHGYRKAVGASRDPIAVELPRPLYYANFASLFGIALAFVWGVVRGGAFRFMLWQIQRLIYVPLLFLFFSIVISRAKDADKFGKILLGAAIYRSIMAVFLRRQFPDFEYVTTHADSLLFATTTCMLIIRFFEERTKQSLYWLLGCLPIIVAGMVENDRRLVWVEIIVAAGFVFARLRKTFWKIAIVRAAVVSMPLLFGYLAVGWNSGSGLFKPVQTVKSIVDSKSDASTKWRDLENFNLVTTLKRNPILGSGFGHPFEMAVAMPDVTAGYELEPYAPHNSILGMWAYLGYVGFFLQWSGLLVMLYLCVRVAKHSAVPRARTVALTIFCSTMAYMLHLYGDMALGTVPAIFLLSVGMVLVGKLAVETGTYPSALPRN